MAEKANNQLHRKLNDRYSRPLLLSLLALCLIPLAARAAPKWRIGRLRVVTGNAKSVDWLASKNLIASARRGEDDYYDVFVVKPDGSGYTLLTHAANCPQKHNGNPAWRPAGDYLVFTAQNERMPPNPAVDRKFGVRDRFSFPGSGLGCDLWAMSADGKKFQRLTRHPIRRPFRGVIHPQFSPDGARLVWTERVKDGDSFGGGWVIRLADVTVDPEAEQPLQLRNVATLTPAGRDCFYETHDFSPDGKRLLISGNLEQGQPDTGLDVYELELATGKTRRLTNSLKDWDEHAHYSPDGKHVIWMSNTGINDVPLTSENWMFHLKTELWIMDADGANQQRLTSFNTPGRRTYMKGARCIVSDNCWRPDGSQVLLTVAAFNERGKAAKMLLIDLAKR